MVGTIVSDRDVNLIQSNRVESIRSNIWETPVFNKKKYKRRA